MPPSSNAYFPAQLILPADDVPLYLEWQKSNFPRDTPGAICAIQYYEFVQHRSKDDNNSKLSTLPKCKAHTAAECSHELHPSDIIMAGYCPTCEVKMSLTFLDAIAKAFQEAGGPWYDKGVTKEAYLHLRRGWHLARLQLQETVDVIKVSVAYEAQWEAEHPDEVAAAQKANTSTKAVQMAEMEQKYPAVVSVVLASEAMRKLSKASIRPKERKSIKKVTFVPGTNFKPSRHSAKYHRGSRCYQPGVHTCKPGTEWLNVSRCGSIPADLCNLKIFVTTSHDEFDKLDRDATLRPGQMQGLVGSHPGAKVISDFTQKFQELRDGGTEELVQMVKHADAMIVLVEGDNVLDVYLSHSNDIEDEDGEEDVVDQSRWTCLKEIMASM